MTLFEKAFLGVRQQTPSHLAQSKKTEVTRFYAGRA
jgi:hypothetical protein